MTIEYTGNSYLAGIFPLQFDSCLPRHGFDLVASPAVPEPLVVVRATENDLFIHIQTDFCLCNLP